MTFFDFYFLLYHNHLHYNVAYFLKNYTNVNKKETHSRYFQFIIFQSKYSYERVQI